MLPRQKAIRRVAFIVTYQWLAASPCSRIAGEETHFLGMSGVVGTDPAIQQRQRTPNAVRQIITDQLSNFLVFRQVCHQSAADDSRYQKTDDLNASHVVSTGDEGGDEDADDGDGSAGNLE